MNPISPAAGSRGDSTRDALIRAAIEVFGRDGFNAASTRAISRSAGVNQALIGYHFGGKPGLYLAALRHIADSAAARMAPQVTAIETELARDGQGADAARRAVSLLQELMDAFVGMLTSEQSSPWARLILREQQEPSDGFDVLYHGIMQRILDAVTRLVARIQGVDPDSRECRLRAIAILGQALVFRTARAAVMRALSWPELGTDELAAIRTELRRNIRAIVAGGPDP